jgi:tetratricopeptide (TPR) repeat protein
MFSDDHQVLLNKAMELEKKGDPNSALNIYKDLVKVFPRVPALYFNMGNISFDGNDYHSAKKHFEKAIEIDSNFKEAHFNLGNTLKKIDEVSSSAYHFERSIQIDPEFESAYFNLANLAKEKNKFLTAIRNYKETLRISPDNYVARSNLVFTYMKKVKSLFYQGKIQEIKPFLEEALKYDPEHQRTSINMAVYCFYMGRFKEGFSYYKRRCGPEKRTFRREEFKVKKIEEFLGKDILLVNEQGIGDQLFFLRFTSMLKKLGFRVYVVANEKIKFLLKQSKQFEEVYGDLEDVSEDLNLEPMLMGDIGYALGIKDLKEMPLPLVLNPDEKSLLEVEKKIESFKDKPLVGLTWRAGAMGEENYIAEDNDSPYSKNIEVEELAKSLYAIKNKVHFISLQRNPQKAEFKRLKDALGVDVHDFSEYNKDLSLMLALLSKLDDYISVSNANLHLHACLQKKAHMMISYPWDWRWVGVRDICVGYPFFNSYRQTSEGVWKNLRELSNNLSKKYL